MYLQASFLWLGILIFQTFRFQIEDRRRKDKHTIWGRDFDRADGLTNESSAD
jgi:hypothetical protein